MPHGHSHHKPKMKPKITIRSICPNFNREDALDTVLEVPIPEELFASLGNNLPTRWQNMATWMKAQTPDKWSSPIIVARYNEMSFLLHIVGSPLLPSHIQVHQSIQCPVKQNSVEASTAKYIIQQYLAATGGLPALNAVNSICVTGQMKIGLSGFHQGDENVKMKNKEEVGGFVLWHQNPDLWCLELIISGCKVISGSNGKESWRQSSNQQRPISKGPPRPLRRFLQGLDPRAMANLFIDALCEGEKIINNEECFILRLDASQSALEAQGKPKHEIIQYTIWGYFSQRSGLLVKFEDSQLLSVKMDKEDGDVFWEMSSESTIEHYKYVDGVNIAHGGTTKFTVFRYREESKNHKRELQETWKVEDIGFNARGLKPEFFMPPTDFHKNEWRIGKA